GIPDEGVVVWDGAGLVNGETYNLRNGSLIARYAIWTSGSASFEQSGGFLAGDLQIGNSGRAFLQNGQRELSSLTVEGTLVQNNGSTRMTNSVAVGTPSAGGGDLVLNGGSFEAVQLWAFSCKFTQNDGAASLGTMLVGYANDDNITLSHGVFS